MQLAAKKKRQGKEQIKRKQFQPMPVIPEYFVRIEKQVLTAEIAGYSSHTKKKYVGNKGYREILQKALLEKS